jgi:hypothetical protein
MSRIAERVVAAIAAPRGPQAERSLAAIEGSNTRPVETMTGEDALEQAVRVSADWIWVVEGGGVPAPDALERLLEASATDPTCVISAGLVVDADGDAIELLVPAGTERETEAVLRLAQARLLPIRNATFAHTLVRRDALAQHGLPDWPRLGRYAAIEWSARVLAQEGASGVLVPSSIVRLHDDAMPQPADLLAAARTARTSTWTRGEAVRQLGAILRSRRAVSR